MDGEAQQLTEKHFQDVMKMSKDFRVYMERTRKMDERKRAALRGYRYDMQK